MGNSVFEALSLGRRAAESRMLDSVSVSRAGERTWDEDNGDWVTTPVSVYVGKARIRHATTAGDAVDAGSQLLVVGRLEVHVPVGTTDFEPGDEITVTACPTRPEQVGRVFRVVAPFDGSQTVALKYRVEVADGRG